MNSGIFQGSGSGSSAPGLPVWTYDPALTGTPAAGHFQLDNTNPSLAQNIFINVTPKDNGTLDLTEMFEYIYLPSTLITSLLTGKVYSSYVGSNFTVSGAIAASGFGGGNSSVDSVEMSGDYSFAFSPSNQVQTITFGALQANAGISPIADNTYPISGTLGGSITTQSGVITAISEAS
jgi:hypothetical protein